MTYTVTNPVHGYSSECRNLQSALVAASMIWDGAGIVAVITDSDGNVLWGVGSDPNIITASLRAVLAAHERRVRNA